VEEFFSLPKNYATGVPLEEEWDSEIILNCYGL
jgi:hypothetical protein